MSDNKEAQEDELLALTSIYDEEEFHRAECAQGGEIQLCLPLSAHFRVVVKGRPRTPMRLRRGGRLGAPRVYG